AAPCLYLTASRFRNPQQPPRFAAFLRAHLQAMRLHDITVRPYDRVVSFCWEQRQAPGATLRLLHELQGQQANVLLVDAEDMILDALKYAPPSAGTRRTIVPGERYQPFAAPPSRLLLPALTVEMLQQLQAQGTFDAAHMQRLVIGLSPVLAAELLHRSHGQPRVCWELLQELRQHYDQGTFTVALYTTPHGEQHLSVLPLTHCACTVTSFPGAQQAVAAVYEPSLEAHALDQLRRATHKSLQQRLRKLRQKMHHLAQDRQKLESYHAAQRYGTLLVTQHVPRGSTSVTVVDYYSPTQAPVTIALDPRLSLQDNARVYFKRYRKAQHGLEKIQERLAQCSVEEQSLETLEQQLVHAEDWDTVETIALELGGTPTVPLQRTRGETPAALPYRQFVLSDGSLVYCGKSNQGNEVLLRQVAAPEDLWLHAHRQAGAHVVLKLSSPTEVSPGALQQAAALAAFYSKGKHAAAVEVMYTPAKNVRKFRGARPGQVQVSTYRTLEVTPQLPATTRAM
ncbi:MAG: fibronectin-binding domain-containing protein, partial [Candidatus Tectomicrobia bacterium]|nr:fibronectin-binding domain-containing protein [Candidatus Tectomicrobia bacterium]